VRVRCKRHHGRPDERDLQGLPAIYFGPCRLPNSAVPISAIGLLAAEPAHGLIL
jgi:hypothetical protein